MTKDGYEFSYRDLVKIFKSEILSSPVLIEVAKTIKLDYSLVRNFKSLFEQMNKSSWVLDYLGFKAVKTVCEEIRSDK